MKKFSILFFAIIFLLTPLFFSSANNPVPDTPGTTGPTITPNNSSTSVTLSSSNESSNGTTIKATGLNSNASYNIVIKNGTTVIQPSNSVYSNSPGTAEKLISGLLPKTSYTASIYSGSTSTGTALKTVPFWTTPADKTILKPTLLAKNWTSSSVDLVVGGIPEDGIYPYTIIIDKSLDSENPITVGDEISRTFTISELESGTSYTASLYVGTIRALAADSVDFVTKLLTGTLTKGVITSNSAKIDVGLLKGTEFHVYIRKQGDGAGVYITNLTATGTTDINGKATVTFNGLSPNTDYFTMLAYDKGNNIDTREFTTLLVDPVVTPPVITPPVITPPTTTLNYVDLFKNVRGAVDRIAQNREGDKPNNYEVGSKTQLSTVLNERYSNSGELLLNKGFTLQPEIDAFNTKLQAAIVVFEKRKVGAATVGGDMSSTGGGLVPDCPEKGCGFKELMTLINNLIQFLLFTVATPLAAIIIAYVGWLYLSSGGNPGDITKAKKILLNVVIGYVIGLAAWLIVKTIVSSLGVDPTINTFLK